ncbi:MAG: iron-sulfur cluster assembly scaffold protein [Candidatus Marinimicrobia bacterium]|nr:iron-sulfur cluster assembly scaffold protein [Candidatus Neomarinimicrobiota bacterium]MCF7827560.1 iron-sulfur cluster assembly scaffold protein [Candidatus Neomarinimicrobiota bacterium]MCF7881578.1 iron-sulfur cluster assembly scaffold protein [Candidatus Neomarinimicrobiota bacterium]
MSISPADTRQSRVFRKHKIILQQMGYSNKAISLILNKTNLGALDNPSVCMTFQSDCGDTLILYANFTGNIFREVKFQYIGCVGLLSSASALSLLLQDKSLEEAANIQESDIYEYLEFIPEGKHDCVEFTIESLHTMVRRLKK